MNPEVSIIIPVYNTEAYIARAIESALAQTEKNIELIIVDDGSTDKSLEIIQSFSDKRIKLIINKENRGQNYCTNLAFKKAQGNWITRLDSDDWYSINRLEELLKIANSENADMIADDIYFIQDGKRYPWSTLLIQSNYKFKNHIQIDPIFFIQKDVPGSWNLPLGLTKPLIRRSFINKYQIKNEDNILIGGDFWLYLTCLAYGAKFLLIPKPYYFYRSRNGSLVTLSQVKRLDAYCKATEVYLKQDFINKNPKLLAALQKRLMLIENNRPYFKVIDAIKQSDYINSLRSMISQPSFFYHFVTQLPKIIRRKILLYFNQINLK